MQPEVLADLLLKTLSLTEGGHYERLAELFNELARALGTAEPERVRQVLEDAVQRASDQDDRVIRPAIVGPVLAITFEHVLPALVDRARLTDRTAADVLWSPFLYARICNTVLKYQSQLEHAYRVARAVTKEVASFLGYRPTPVLEGEERARPRAAERTVVVPVYLRGVGIAFHKYGRWVELWLERLKATPESLLGRAGVSLEDIKEIAIDPRDYDFFHPVWFRPGHLYGEYDPDQVNLSGNYERYVVRRWLLEAADKYLEEAPEEREFRQYEAAVGLGATMLLSTVICGSSASASSEPLARRVALAAELREDFYRYQLENAPEDLKERLQQERRVLKQAFASFRLHTNRSAATLRAAQAAYEKATRAALAVRDPAFVADLLKGQKSRTARRAGEIRLALLWAELSLPTSNLQMALAEARRAYSLILDGVETGDMADPWCIIGFSGQYPLGHAPTDAVPDRRIVELVELVDATMRVCARVGVVALLSSQGERLAEATELAEDLLEWWSQFGVNAVAEVNALVSHVPVDCSRYDIVLDAVNRIYQEQGDLLSRLPRVHDSLTAETAYWLAWELLERDRLDEAAEVIIRWLGAIRPAYSDDDQVHVDELVQRWFYKAALAEKGSVDADAVWTRISRFVDSLIEAADPWLSMPLGASLSQLSSFYEKAEDWIAPRYARELPTGQRAEVGGEELEEEEGSEREGEGEEHEGHSWDETRGGEALDEIPSGEPDELTSFGRDLVSAIQLHLELQTAVASFLANIAGYLPDPSPDRRPEQQEAFVRWVHLADKLFERTVGFVVATDSVLTQEFDRIREAGPTDELGRYLQRIAALTRPVMRIASIWALACDRLVSRLDRSERRSLGPLNVQWATDLADLRADLFSGRPIKKSARALKRLVEICSKYVDKPLPEALEKLLEGELTEEAMRNLESYVDKLIDEQLAGGRAQGMESLEKGVYQLALILVAEDIVRTLVYTGHLYKARCLVGALADLYGGRPQPVEGDSYQLRRIVALTWCRALGHVAGRLIGQIRVREGEGAAEAAGERERLLWSLMILARDIQRLFFTEALRPEVTVAGSLLRADTWEEVRSFVQEFGADLFTPQFLNRDVLAGIIANRGLSFMDELMRMPASERPVVASVFERATVDEKASLLMTLSVIARSILDHYSVYTNYNTTTAYSDYGNLLYILLDFIRVRESIRFMEQVCEPFDALYRGALETSPENPESWGVRPPGRLVSEKLKLAERLRQVEAKYGVVLGTVRAELEAKVERAELLSFVRDYPKLMAIQAPITRNLETASRWRQALEELMSIAINQADPEQEWFETLVGDVCYSASRPYTEINSTRGNYAALQEKEITLEQFANYAAQVSTRIESLDELLSHLHEYDPDEPGSQDSAGSV